MYFNCHTSYSFKYGTLSPEDLFNEARRCNVHKLVLTEINNTASYVEMIRICEENGVDFSLDVAVGIEFRNKGKLLYIGLARNNAGFQELNRFLSWHNTADIALPDRAPEMQDVHIVYPVSRAPEILRTNEWIGVRPTELSKVNALHLPESKLVAWHPVTFSGKKTDYNVHRLLRAIDNNTLLSKLPPTEQAPPDEVMLPGSLLRGKYPNHSVLVSRAEKLVDECSLHVTLGVDKNKRTFTGGGQSDWELLVAGSREGFARRYDQSNLAMNERFERELDTIRRKDFVSYYLITWDIIRFARHKGFEYVGRGSGANSLIAYCLGITNVDPIELDLYFERFLNPERTSPPDFDIDFSWKDRDAITKYIFDTHGARHVCLLGTHTTYQDRSVLRELGKVFGLPKAEIDNLVDYPRENRGRDHITRLIFNYAERIHEMPSNLSIHAGGVLITHDPIHAFTATNLPPKGYPVSHLEMHSAEDLGIYKFDILSQRGLGHLKESAEWIQRNRNIEVDTHRFEEFKQDPAIRELIREGRTMGCFYVESPAMRMLLGKLRCEDYLTLVAASSIIRPGVARSGMMRAYIERFHLTEQGQRYESIHPTMDQLMESTYGVMVYQEDVIKVAHHFAGLTLAEADILRRGMSGKFRSRKEFERVKSKFFENCRNRNYSEAVTARVWYEIESFSGYSFSKGHSASYAVESYQSLYLKAHYPLEFMVAVINNFGGFYKTEFYFHEARMNGARIEAPCINHSEQRTSIIGQTIYAGFIHLKSLESKIAEEIEQQRKRHGPYQSLHQFLTRIRPGLEQVRLLIRVGAFRFTGKSRQQLLWEAMLYYSETKATRLPSSDHLFQTAPREYPLPELERHPLEDAFDELELLGFPLSDPFDLLSPQHTGDCLAKDLPHRRNRRVHLIGYIVTTKDTMTIDNKPMHFGTFYDRQGAMFDTVHFPPVAIRHPFRGRGFYSIQGKVMEDFGVFVIEVERMEKLPMINPRSTSQQSAAQTASIS